MKKYVVIVVALVFLGLFSCNSPKNNNPELIQKEMITKDITFIPEGVCCKQMDISVVNDTIRSVKFTKGCPGNTQGVARLIVGMAVDDAIAQLDGIRCGEKETSCPDQLAKALKTIK